MKTPKNRKVVITLEVETNLTLKELKDSFEIGVAKSHQGKSITVTQVQSNVVKAAK